MVEYRHVGGSVVDAVDFKTLRRLVSLTHRITTTGHNPTMQRDALSTARHINP